MCEPPLCKSRKHNNQIVKSPQNENPSGPQRPRRQQDKEKKRTRETDRQPGQDQDQDQDQDQGQDQQQNQNPNKDQAGRRTRADTRRESKHTDSLDGVALFWPEGGFGYPRKADPSRRGEHGWVSEENAHSRFSRGGGRGGGFTNQVAAYIYIYT